ncbi:sulfatase-like hydrolase/transferase [Cyclobacterium jeungdonense]|uniref:Sulfatase-like hydrolase/transferase n=1 Tax=Cyclobacterium jeungdonense TaxID=708087 RepID=A0ABT8CDT2_9BACT|nr:sulfatase-like hydrolase/transferase [Cyclobacterium jeungdonense]MDN3689851.1 sulfatase-like hydrolase/transferase [Cyclobacterium jeungdonense]
MNKLFSIMLLVVFGILMPEFAFGKRPVDKKPNIIFILTDDLGYGDLGVLYQNQRKAEGKPYHSTPNLDKMANEGMILTRHYVPAPVCAPSRATLLLGLHQGHAEVRNNQFDKALPANHNLATVLKEAGYATVLIGKYGLQGLEGASPSTWDAYPTKRGFDYFFGYVRHRDGHNHYPAHDVANRGPMELYDGDDEISASLAGSYTTDLFTARAKKYIQDHKNGKPDQPFFMYLAYDTPHAGLEIPTMPYPAGGGISGGVKYIGEKGNFINTAQGEVNSFIHPEYRNEEWPEVQQRFASMVRRIDNAVGDLIHLLQDLGIDEETLIVFTSDNGPHHESYGYGEYDPIFFESFANLDGTKRDTWEGGIRVPTLVRWPGKIKAGVKNDSPSGFHDWLPTFAEISGLPAPANTDGRSLWSILSGNANEHQGRVYIEYQVNNNTKSYDAFHEAKRGKKRGEMQVLYLNGYKGIRYNILSHQDDFSIFDTKNDPGESRDLAGTNGEFVKLQQEMKNTVLRWRRPNTSAERPYDNESVPAIEPERKLTKGIKVSKYQIDSPWVPFISTSLDSPYETLIVPKIKALPAEKGFPVLVYEGFIKAETTGEYEISFNTNSGLVMHIHEALLIDDDKPTIAKGKGTSKVLLEKGFHPIKLVTKNSDNGENPKLELKWTGPGFQNTDLVVYH